MINTFKNEPIGIIYGMVEKIFFQCSLPRSGSTLLQNVLAQNPDFYATPTSGLIEIFLNAKEESAFISAKESIGLNARTLNFDAKDYMCVDANKIYLLIRFLATRRSKQNQLILFVLAKNLRLLFIPTLPLKIPQSGLKNSFMTKREGSKN